MSSEENNRQDYDKQQNYDNRQDYNSRQDYDRQEDYNSRQGYDEQQNYTNRGNYEYNGYQRPPKTPQPVSGMSIAALILGVLSIVCSCCGAGGIIFGALGIIIAVMSKGHESMQTPSKIGLGLSIAGLVLGIILTIMLFAFSSYIDTDQRIQSFEYETQPYEESPYGQDPAEEYPDDSYRYYNGPQDMPYSRDLQDLFKQNEPQAL
ncbi:DUF4190 domain-containing protein [Blautia schinkii]|nr:DUF4190 domain-containing protein [Blautia schinkii]